LIGSSKKNLKFLKKENTADIGLTLGGILFAINKFKIMEIKNINPMTVLYCTTRTNLAGLSEFVGTKAEELLADASSNNLTINGPVYWLYYGMDGKPETVFDLDIAFPVIVNQPYNGNFKLKELPKYKCLSAIHTGAWNDMDKTYNSLIGRAMNDGLLLNNTCREVYLNVDFIDFTKNITEIELGII
jgi:effector-binding domain-containing protein